MSGSASGETDQATRGLEVRSFVPHLRWLRSARPAARYHCRRLPEFGRLRPPATLTLARSLTDGRAPESGLAFFLACDRPLPTGISKWSFAAFRIVEVCEGPPLLRLISIWPKSLLEEDQLSATKLLIDNIHFLVSWLDLERQDPNGV